MANIYELPKEIEQALFEYYACFDEETGELTVEENILDEKQKALGELQNKKDELLTWYLQDRANKLAENIGLQSEIDRLSKRVAINKKRIERVEKIVDYNFKELYKDKAIAFGNFTVNYRKSKATIIDNEELVPKEYIKEKVTLSTDKTAIKKAIESGVEVPGAYIEERQSLSIK